MISTVQRRKTLVSKTALKFPFDESAISPIIWNHQLLSWMILIVCLIGYSLSETSSPLNLAVVEGTRARLNCSTLADPEKTPIWWHASYRYSNDESVYERNRVTNLYNKEFSVDVSVSGNVDLLFEACTNCSGRYTCQKKGEEPEFRHTSQVIVLDAKPKCSKKKSSDGFVKATCSIGFSGFWSPELEWRNANAKLETDDTTTIPNISVTSFFVVRYRTSAPYDLTCTPKFTLTNKPKDEPKGNAAQNIPEFPNRCTIKIERSDGGNNPPEETTTKPVTDPPKETTTKSGNGHSKETTTKSGNGQSKGRQPKEDKGKDDPSATDTPSATLSIHDWHNLHLSLSLATLVFIGMLHKWLWQ